MKIKTSVVLEVISDSSLTEFQSKVNSFCKGREIVARNYSKDNGEYTAFIDHVEKNKIPEDIRDEYEIAGEVYRCKNCPKWGSNYTDDTKGAFLCHAKVTKKTVRGCEPACLFFYEKLARGEIRPYE